MVLFAIIALATTQNAQDPLTVDQAVEIALRGAFSIRVAASATEKSKKLESQAKGAFGPNIALEGTFTKFEGGGSSGSGGDSKSGSLTLTQPIDISGLSRKALQATVYNRMATEAAAETEANNVKFEVRASFYSVLLRTSLVKVQLAALASANERLQKARIREREGVIPRFDVLRLQNEAKKTEQALEQANGQLKLARQNLNSLLARSIETDFSAVPIESLPTLPANVADLVTIAINNRPEIKQAKNTIAALDRLADVQGASFAPRLSINAAHTRFLDPGQGQGSHTTQGSLILTVPLFDSGISRAAVDAAKSDTDQARIRLEQTLLGVALEVRNAWTLAETAKRTYDVALDSEGLATESMRLAEIRYNEGAGILVDVTQAQADLTGASGTVQSAKYDYLEAIASLMRAMGTDDLTASEIKQ